MVHVHAVYNAHFLSLSYLLLLWQRKRRTKRKKRKKGINLCKCSYLNGVFVYFILETEWSCLYRTFFQLVFLSINIIFKFLFNCPLLIFLSSLLSSRLSLYPYYYILLYSDMGFLNWYHISSLYYYIICQNFHCLDFERIQLQLHPTSSLISYVFFFFSIILFSLFASYIFISFCQSSSTWMQEAQTPSTSYTWPQFPRAKKVTFIPQIQQ